MVTKERYCYRMHWIKVSVADASSRYRTAAKKAAFLLKLVLERGLEEQCGVSDAGAAAGEGVEAADEGEGVRVVEAAHVHELAQLELVGADEVGVGVRDRDEGRVEGVGELQEVAARVERRVRRHPRHDLRDLQEGLPKLRQHARGQRGHRQSPRQFLWMPYREFQSSLPAVVVWHQTDRVQLQFGLWKPIPNEAHNLDKMHDIDMKRHSDTNWAQQHADWISIWKDRRKHVIFGEPLQGPLQHTPEYLQWFRTNSKLFLCSQYSSSHASTSSTQLPTTTATAFPIAGDNHPPYSVKQHPQSYPSFHTHHEQFMYTPPSTTTPTGDFMSNLFGVDVHTPQSAYNYMQSMNFPSFSSYHSEVGGSGSSNPVTDTVNIEHDEDQVEPQQPRIGRRNPTRNRQPPRCGTGGHRHH
uniref:Serine/threonine protein phosphatase 7 long form isogeny n=1 Tax=Cajanus cajan TaxID=3821 RepID=A0A151SW73_CAJCA|nr:Serine/threonine protein phosphatase 7 long form isogeny [Cajanus cajan]